MKPGRAFISECLQLFAVSAMVGKNAPTSKPKTGGIPYKVFLTVMQCAAVNIHHSLMMYPSHI